jgi:DnaJ-class molecular chaperone
MSRPHEAVIKRNLLAQEQAYLANRNKLAWTYHPDVHKSEMTGLTPEGAKQYMQVINRAYEFLQEYFKRG